MKKIILFFSILIQVYVAQTQTKSVEIQRISNKPVIDGIISEDEWKNFSTLDDFIQYAPYNGDPATEPSIAKIGYDDDALYIMIYFYDSQPEKITRLVSSRDEIHKAVNDLLYVVISPYKDNNNAYNFVVTPTGAQQDEKLSLKRGADISWNTVWISKTAITEKGWFAEIKIPLSALRFPSKDLQDWKFNIWRRSNRLDEWTSWNYVDNETGSFFNSNGLLKGFKDLKPPLRLSFTPYVSAYTEKSANGNKSNTFNAGMDIKYGINESYTLDAILIPDFDQVQSDDQELNLSPYEIKFDENRQFFTEGVELFSKGNIFYSRRIGNTPSGYWNVRSQLKENEIIDENPNTNELINAVKVSGRNSSGLAIGVLNAMTSATDATIKNTVTGETREIETQGFTNYNMLVIDKQLSSNSFLSFANTNVKRKNYLANVFATDFRIANESNSYALTGTAAVSYIDNDGNDNTGFSVNLEAGKISGNFQYLYSLEIIDDKYNPNDLGFLWRGNEIINKAILQYNLYRPFSIFLNMNNNISFTYKRNYSPDLFTYFNIKYNFHSSLKNRMFFDFYFSLTPVKEHDLYITQIPGREMVMGKSFDTGIYTYTDSRKPLSFLFTCFYIKTYDFDPQYEHYLFSLTPKYKIGGKAEISFKSQYQNKSGNLGVVNYIDNIVYAGERDVITIENYLKMHYKFNNDFSVNLKVRHYWSEATYNKFYILNTDGYTENTDYNAAHDVNYNTFTLDLKFRWNFMPGSEISVVWKNAISKTDNEVDRGYFRNLSDILEADQANALSLKMLYYIDYLSL